MGILLLIFVVSSLTIVILKKIVEFKQLAKRAEFLKNQDSGNPLETKQLQQAFQLCQQCNHLLNDSLWLQIAVSLKLLDKEVYLQSTPRIQEEINRRNYFQKLFFQGKEQAKQKFFERALAIFVEAKQLFVIEELKTEITSCQYQLEKQEKYEKILKQANNLAIEGRFQGAIELLKPALIEFSRADGKNLLNKLEQVARGKEYFLFGLKLEKEGRLHEAKNNYKQAVNLIPELTECHIRLGIIALKNNNCSEVFSHLDNIAGEQAAYIRGFAYAKQEKWQQADREWQSISHNDVKAQRQNLKILAHRDRLSTMSKIEQFVDSGNLEQAKSISLEFIQKFGVHPLVEDNLQGHIQPILETKIWKTQDWNNIATTTEQFWIESQDITSLHNWAVATYYQAQINPNKLANLIIAWSTALANLQIDQSLKDLPWLENITLDLEQVSTNLTELLEKLIDAVKDRDVEQYLQLRDLYRCETLALRLIKSSPNTGVRVKQLLLSPGCYQRHLNNLPIVNLPVDPWGALYTNWGQTVAACIEGDPARAIQIKPKINPSSVAEQSADFFVAYHEGCYYFQQHDWRKAITILKPIKEKIRTSSDWSKEIDRLCEKQRQKLDNFDEHFEFAHFWYDILASQPASSYLAEYKARQIADKIANEKISNQNALSELEAIKKIDPHNPVVIDLIELVEFTQEAEQIDRLLKSDRFEEAVRRAKSSKNYKIRFLVAEICLDILIKGVENRSFSFELIHQLGRWAYELCPNEPAFQEIYRSLKIYY